MEIPDWVQIVGREVVPGDFCDVEHLLPPSLSRASPKRKTEYLARPPVAKIHRRRARMRSASGWLGCISHSNGRTVAAVSNAKHSRLLGVDVEKLIYPALADGIGALVTLKGELAMLTGRIFGDAPGHSLSQALASCFQPRSRSRRPYIPMLGA